MAIFSFKYYGAASPEVGHQDAPPGAECGLSHHPLPCPWVGERGEGCTYEPGSLLLPSLLPPPATPAQLSANSSEAPGEDLTLLQQVEQLRREREEAARRANVLEVANQNLKENQDRLQREFLNLRFPNTSCTVTTSTTSSTSFSSLSTTTSMGTGFSAGFGIAIPSTSVSGSVPGYLAGAAQQLAQSNARPVQPTSSIPNYSGPTIPDLRNNQGISNVAQEVLSVLFRDIPALAPHGSALSASAPIPSHPASFPSLQQPFSTAAPPHIPASVYLPPQQLQAAPVSVYPHLLGVPRAHAAPPVDPSLQHLDAMQQQIDQFRNAQVQRLSQTHNSQFQDQDAEQVVS